MTFALRMADVDELAELQKRFNQRLEVTAESRSRLAAVADYGSSASMIREAKGRPIMDVVAWSAQVPVFETKDVLPYRGLVPVSSITLGDGGTLKAVFKGPAMLAVRWVVHEFAEASAFSMLVTYSQHHGCFLPVVIPPLECLGWLSSERDARNLYQPAKEQWV